MADSLVAEQAAILQANALDMEAAKGTVSDVMLDRLALSESRIAGMIPSLDEAAREYSDLQAEILQHIHSEKYIFANSDCPVCNGLGKEFVTTTDADGNETPVEKVCHHCHGRGTVTNVSPYGEYIINAAKFGEQNLPTPPIGYVQKNTDIAKFEDEHVRQHIYDALAAINMEFLA